MTRTVGIGSGVIVVPGRRVGSQNDSLITMMMSGFSSGTMSGASFCCERALIASSRIALRRGDLGHGHIERKGDGEAVAVIVLLLVPHDRGYLQPVARPREGRIVHHRPEEQQRRQGHGQPREPRAFSVNRGARRRQKRHAVTNNATATMADRGEKQRGTGSLAHEQRHEFDDLPGIEEIGRVERIAEVERLLLADKGKPQRNRRQQEQGNDRRGRAGRRRIRSAARTGRPSSSRDGMAAGRTAASAQASRARSVRP